jgi:hypothetical protein
MPKLLQSVKSKAEFIDNSFIQAITVLIGKMLGLYWYPLVPESLKESTL